MAMGQNPNRTPSEHPRNGILLVFTHSHVSLRESLKNPATHHRCPFLGEIDGFPW